ncbi:MAG TPA: PQQ-dependent sugar dehydrogenase [Gaiellaceae bacterium]|nr:PQQ-dependent sugar dehydrogenase [Gaiellaceae bacterium]
MRAAAALMAVAAVVAPLAAATGDRAHLRFRPIASGLRGAWFIGAPRSEPNRLYVVEKGGWVRVLVDGRLRKQPFLDISSLVESAGPEQGLFSIAFHPRYARNHRFYVAYTDNRGDFEVAEYRSNGVRAVRRQRRLLFLHEPFTRHAGGQLQFGPEGLLYLATGDGSKEGDPANRAQDLATKLGKLLRLDVDRRGARWQAIGYGLRFPWRFSFDRRTGALYLGDRGPRSWEEVDLRPRAKLGALANYGWSRYEGFEPYKSAGLNRRGELVFPVAVHSHRHSDAREACQITGGYVYRGSAVPAARGRYVYGDAYTSEIWSFGMSRGKATDIRREPMKIESVSTFGEDARGELYAAAPRQGRIYKLSAGG